MIDSAPLRTGHRTAPPAEQSFGAIDLGTNNCRLLIGTPTADGFRVVDSFSRIIRLGEGLAQTGALGAPAIGRAMEALHACAARLTRRDVRQVRGIATEACRQATNGAAFLARVRHETGLPMTAITTREEAELALESCAPLLDRTARRALLFDIGGGSTEIAWIRLGGAPQLIGYASLPVGVVSLAERFGAHGLTSPGYEAMVAEVAARLTGLETIHCIGRELRAGGVQMLGTSGTATTLAGIALNLQRYRRPLVDGLALSSEAIDAALDTLRTLAHTGGQDALAGHPCIGPERAAFVLPGCAIFQAIHRTWPAAAVTVADRGLREGMLLRMMRSARPMRGPGHARERQPGRPPTL